MVKKIILILFSGGIILYSLRSLYKILTTVAPDFSVYFAAAQSLIHHHSLYTISVFTIFNYPPISALFFIPFSFLPYPIAQGIFVCLSYFCTFLCVFLCFKILDQKITWVSFLFMSSLFLLSFPTKFTLGMGQSNLVAYCLLLLSVYLEQNKKYIFAGILLTLAIILKPIFIFLLLYFLFNRSWKVIVVCIITGLFFLTLQQVFFPQTFAEWIQYMTHILPELMTTKGREVYYNQGLLGTISRFTHNIQIRQLFDSVGILVVLSDVIKNLFYTKKNYMRLAILLCTLPLIDSLSWQHHFVLLLFPFFVAYYALRKHTSAVMLLTSVYILISANIKNPEKFLHFPLSIALSHVFFGTLLLLGVLLYIVKRLQRGERIALK